MVATLATVTLMIPISAHAADDCPGADLVPSVETVREVTQATLCVLNAQRDAHGLGGLTESVALTRAAGAYSTRMVGESFFAHVAPDGSDLVTRLDAVSYLAGASWAVGENIAWGQGPLSSARSIVGAWMNSPAHRANVLGVEYAEIGIGIVLGIPGDLSWGATFTTDFGTRAGIDAVAQPARSGARRPPRAATRAPICARAAGARRTTARRRGRVCGRIAGRVAR